MNIAKRDSSTKRAAPRSFARVVLALAASALFFVTAARAQDQAPATPDAQLAEALAAACRQDATTFAGLLTSENGTAFRALPSNQRTALMKRFVLLDDPGKPLFSTSSEGHRIVRCDAAGSFTEMRLGEVRAHDNLAFVPMEIPIEGVPARAITFGMVREDGKWKLLSVGLLLMDIPAMAKQWEQADLEANEDSAIAELRDLATALETYRNAYGKLPESLATLGPAPKGGISPETAGLVDADLAAGRKDGYTFRYAIVPSSANLPDEEANKAAGFALAASPEEYGKIGKRSFFLDSVGVLRGADKQGAVATPSDPRVVASP